MKTIPDSLKKIFITAIFSCISLLGYSQDSTLVAKNQSLSPAGNTNGVNYFKIEIGIIVNCPVLPTCLKEKLMSLKGIDNYKKDQMTQSITFNIPDGVITKEQIKTIAIGCAFPEQFINVLMSNKPFTN